MLRLVSANLNYSSWSMRAYLALELAGVEYKLHDVGLFTKPGWEERIAQFSGAGKVPVLIDGSLSVHEALAICEYVSERYAAGQLWPDDLALRARGRAISSEMASSFPALRTHMPTNIRGRASQAPDAPGLASDIARVQDIWEASMATSTGSFLLGDFSIADCMYYPVATRFRTYGVPLSGAASAYSQALFEHPLIQKLEKSAQETVAIERYDALLQG